MKWQLAEHGIDLVQRGGSKPAYLEGDDTKLQLAVTNLVRNAIESIAEAGPPVRRIVVSIRRSRDQLTLSISDSGPGWSGV